jgi:uncharacterized protein
MVIDFHTHIVPPKIRDNRSDYVDRDACFGLLYSEEKAKLVTADELVKNMDKEGVDMSVALNLGWVSHEICVETNDYILESMARYPGRIVGFCAVQPTAGDRALVELERCIAGGMKGLGEMRPDIQGYELDDDGMMAPIVQMLRAHDLVFLTHSSEPVGHQYQGKGSMTPRRLYQFIAQAQGLKIVCAHWGGGLPFYVLMPEVAKAMENVYFDSAASPYLYSSQVYVDVAELVGVNKVLYGSDFPLLSQKRVMDEIKGVFLSESVKDMMLGGNAQRLLKL